MSVCSSSVFSATVLSGASRRSQIPVKQPLTPNQIKAWDEASGKAPPTDEDRVPAHQRAFLPNLKEEKDGTDALRGKRSTREKAKNAPSQITVLGQVDTVYHNPPSDLTVENVANKVPKATMTRIEAARRMGKSDAPIKLHHREFDEKSSNAEDQEGDSSNKRAGSRLSVSGLPEEILLPPKDFVKENHSNGPVEAKYKSLKESLEFSDVNIRNKERELLLLKEMRELKKKQKKLGKVSIKDTMPLEVQRVKNVVPKESNVNNAVHKATRAATGPSKKVKDGAARKNERNVEKLTTGVDVARDRNKLIEGSHMSLMTQRLAQNGESYISSSQHKRQFPNKRVFETPYGHTGQGGCPLHREFVPTKLPTGNGIVKAFVNKEDAVDTRTQKGMNLSGTPPPQLLDHQRALLEGRDAGSKKMPATAPAEATKASKATGSEAGSQ